MTATRKIQGYLLAIVLTLVILVARYGSQHPLGEQALLLPFVLSVVIAAWRGGLGPGLLATFMAAVAAVLVLIPPHFSLRINGDEHTLNLALFVLIGAVVSALCEALHKAKNREVENQFKILADCMPQLVWMAAPDGECNWLNQQWYRYTGFAPGTLEGNGWQQAIAEDEVDRVVQRWNEARNTGTAFEDTFRLRRVDGHLRWFLNRAVPVRDESGELLHWICTCTDIGESKELEIALQQLNQTLEQRVADRTNALQRQANALALAQDQLIAKSRLLQSILDTAPDAIITIDAAGTIVGANRATKRLFDYSEDELIGQNVSILMPPPYCDLHDAYLARYLRTREPRIIGVGREVLARRKDQSIFPCDLAISQVDHQDMFTGIVRDVTERKEMQRVVLEIAAEEDRRIGQELHDNIQQQLTGLGLLSQSLAENLGRQSHPEAKTVSRIAHGLKEAAEHVQQLSRGLIPVDVDADGLGAALVNLAVRISEQYAIDCRCRCTGRVELTDNFAATHLFRIAQEAVNNALKHGRAKRIEIVLRGDSEKVTLEIIDQGVGITIQTEQRPGAGIRTMQHRAGLIGGTVQIQPANRRGTVVRCQVPLFPRQQHDSPQFITAAAADTSADR